MNLVLIFALGVLCVNADPHFVRARQPVNDQNFVFKLPDNGLQYTYFEEEELDSFGKPIVKVTFIPEEDIGHGALDLTSGVVERKLNSERKFAQGSSDHRRSRNHGRHHNIAGGVLNDGNSKSYWNSDSESTVDNENESKNYQYSSGESF
nr:uncharacterized protein LOC116778440 isoform X1 [Danaus plexippus plexippus]